MTTIEWVGYVIAVAICLLIGRWLHHDAAEADAEEREPADKGTP